MGWAYSGSGVTFWVFDAAGNVVMNYPRKFMAVEHANRIGGTWKRGRL